MFYTGVVGVTSGSKITKNVVSGVTFFLTNCRGWT